MTTFTQQQAQSLKIPVAAKSDDDDYWWDTLSNVPGSAYNLVEDTIAPFLSPIETAESMADLGVGLYSLATGGDAPEEEVAEAVGQYFVDRYGSGDALKNSFKTDPVGVAADVLGVFTGGSAILAKTGKLASKGAGMANLDKTAKVLDKAAKVAEKGQKALQKVELDTATPRIVKGATNLGGKLTSELAGVFTGTGSQPIQRAFDVGRESDFEVPFTNRGARAKEFKGTMRESENQIPETQIVAAAEEGLGELQNRKSQNYVQGMRIADLESQPADYSEVLNKISELKKQAYGDGPKAPPTFGPKTMQVLQEVTSLVNDWVYNPDTQTLGSMDRLKRRLDDVEIDAIGTKSGMVKSSVRNAVANEIRRQSPEYSQIMQPYEDAKNLVDDIKSSLSIGDRKTASQSLRKLQQVTRNNVNTNFGRNISLVAELDDLTDFNIVDQLSARALQPLAPTSIGRMADKANVMAVGAQAVDPGAMLNLLPSMPRVAGEAGYYTGRLAKLMSPVTDNLENVSRVTTPLERGGLLSEEDRSLQEQKRGMLSEDDLKKRLGLL